jgi:hypothetical protein
MESLMTAAARTLEARDPIGALNRVALCNDAPAVALRGIAMVQPAAFRRAIERARDPDWVTVSFDLNEARSASGRDATFATALAKGRE